MPGVTETHRGPGRPPEGKKIEVRVPPEVVVEIDREAHKAGVKRAALLREVLLKRFPPRD